LDIDNFISLWQEFYSKLTDEDKILLPLHPIYFWGAMIENGNDVTSNF